MKKLLAVLVALVIAGGTLYLILAVAMGTTTLGCPTALLQGTLVRVDGTLGVESVPPGTIGKVDWPFGYGVGEEDGTLVLTRLFTTVAREGDQFSVGGGVLDDTTFTACGPVSLGLMFQPEEIPSGTARARLTVTGTVYEPCTPPPSGCGYWVSLTSPAFGTDRAPLTHHRSNESAADGDPEPLTLGEGLAPWIEPGNYDLTFEVGEHSDAKSPVAGPGGSPGYPPRVSVACTEELVVPAGATAVTVDATFTAQCARSPWVRDPVRPDLESPGGSMRKAGRRSGRFQAPPLQPGCRFDPPEGLRATMAERDAAGPTRRPVATVPARTAVVPGTITTTIFVTTPRALRRGGS